jgi:hypothetical protein
MAAVGRELGVGRVADGALLALGAVDAHVARDRLAALALEGRVGARMAVDVAVQPLCPGRLPGLPVLLLGLGRGQAGAVASRIGALGRADEAAGLAGVTGS